MTTTFDRVAAALRKHFYDETLVVTPDTRIVADLKLDSLDLVEIEMDLEEAFEFAVEFDDSVFLDLETVGAMVAYVDQVLAAKVAA